MSATPMMGMITVDTTDVQKLADWWCQALEGTKDMDAGEYFCSIKAPESLGGVFLAFQKVPDPTPGKNRIHIDFHAADRDAVVERLVALGAGSLGERSAPGGAMSWVTLLDPDGNQFCVAGHGA